MDRTTKKFFKENYTPIGKHKRKGLTLKPFLSSEDLKLQTVSWIHGSLPEMLWASLILERFDRDGALACFRHIARAFASLPQKNQASNLTLTDIASIPEEDLTHCISSFMFPQLQEAMRPLLLFESLPGYEIWKAFLPEPQAEDWELLSKSVVKLLNHQSQESTDCRWIKVWYMLISDKLKFPESMEESLKEILDYPDYGDMRKVRPSIRAMEMTFRTENPSQWVENFWETCFANTPCLLEDLDEEVGEGINPTAIRICINSLKVHYINCISTTFVDARLDGSFGIVIYALELMFEVAYAGHKLDRGVISRIALRSIVEYYILFEYLNIQVEDKWKLYRKYGAGQAKLAFLKHLESEEYIGHISLETLKGLADEDIWMELLDIDLGHWDRSNLRKMSETAGVKAIYDTYYDSTSAFVHGNWLAVRDEVFTTCMNPLHRLHRVPKTRKVHRESIMQDMVKLLDKMVDSLTLTYPGLSGNLSYFISNHTIDA